MATKAYQAGLTQRIRLLVDEAGGPTAFARRVWGDPLPHKGKVGKWYNGDSGMRTDEAIEVAKKFGRRAAWLLLGELPERPGITRTTAELADDLAEAVGLELDARYPSSSLGEGLLVGWCVRGDALVRLAVDAAALDAERHLVASRGRDTIIAQLDAVESAIKQFAETATKARGSEKKRLAQMSKGLTAIGKLLEDRFADVGSHPTTNTVSLVVRFASNPGVEEK